MPSRFVILNNAGDLDSFIESMKYFSKTSVVIKSREETSFVARVPWIATTNFFYDVLSYGLGALVESGLYERWRILADAGAQLEALDGISDYEPPVNHFARLMLASRREKPVWAEAQEVSLHVMKMPFATCGIFLILPVVVFIWEMGVFSREGIVK